MDELKLIKKTKAGDLLAFEEIVKKYEPRIFYYLVRMCKNRDAAEDMTQETFIQAYKKLDAFQGNSKFSSWLFKIASNYCLMNKRKNKNTSAVSLDEPAYDTEGATLLDGIMDFRENPEELFEKQEFSKILNESLENLPEIYRSTFVLKDIEGFKAKEISNMLNVSLPNVKARVLRARTMLQKELGSKLTEIR